ncbi:MAG: hypothetical protein WBL63_20665, partial [Candidatus Acidiferrum sp.]
MRGKKYVLVGVFLAVLAASTFFGKPVRSGGRVVTHRPVSEFRDWSTRHTLFSNRGFLPDLNFASSDPRASFSWHTRSTGPHDRRPHRPRNRPNGPTLHRDWSINLGAAGTAPAMYPAKFSFDVTQAPSCANDYVVYPIAANGTSSQPNLVAFNNLYSGTTGGTGICNRTPNPPTDTGTSATVLWSYSVQGIAGGGAVPTSPVISYDFNGTGTGTKVAFVESKAGSAAHFHVLAWKSGDGRDSTHLQNALAPQIISAFSATAPAPGSGTATDLALGASTGGTDTLSSPFVDYA